MRAEIKAAHKEEAKTGEKVEEKSRKEKERIKREREGENW